MLGKFHIYVADSERAAVAEAWPYLHHYWTVADDQHPGRAAARSIQAAEQIARGNVIAGEPQRCIDLIQRWRDALGLTVVSGTFYFGGMPQVMALSNRRDVRRVRQALQGNLFSPSHPAPEGLDFLCMIHGASTEVGDDWVECFLLSWRVLSVSSELGG